MPSPSWPKVTKGDYRTSINGVALTLQGWSNVSADKVIPTIPLGVLKANPNPKRTPKPNPNSCPP